jgi:predicted 2-oxoglutarate/Fe(II)-dependent dioxygenase YbiX
MKDLKDYITVFPNIASLELCESIICEYENSNDWTDAIIESGTNLNVRNCSAITVSTGLVIEKNKEVRQNLDDALFQCAAKAIKQYNGLFGYCSIKEDSGYELLRYKTGGFYTQHTDSFIAAPRAVSCSLALNDGYEGGEFAFFDGSIKYKLEKGACIMFPSNFMYPHEITPVTSGTRYSIVTWFL